ncbi:O-antigen ligase family protein [Saccharothrix sp. HUAS TT1]|uniref:O-antigen ligase family protein n=1 Tax=unclassified Saccharothrix TaxID=2593673 RepID=UPI00345C124F
MTWLLRALTCATVFAAPLEGYLLQAHGQLAKLPPALLVGAWVVARVRQRRAPVVHSALGILALLAIVLLITSAVHAGGVHTAEYALRWLPFLLVTAVLVDVVAREVPIRAVLTATVAGAVVAAAGALHTMVAEGGTRASGPLEDPNDLAYFLVAALPLLTALRRSRPTAPRQSRPVTSHWPGPATSRWPGPGSSHWPGPTAPHGPGLTAPHESGSAVLHRSGFAAPHQPAPADPEQSGPAAPHRSRSVASRWSRSVASRQPGSAALRRPRSLFLSRPGSVAAWCSGSVGRRRVEAVAIGVATVVLAAGAAATLSRGGGLALGAAVAWLLFRRALPLRALVGGVVALVVLGGAVALFAGPVLDRALREKVYIAETNVDTRELRWQAAARMVADHPALGVGPGGFRAGYPAASHNAEIDEQTPVAHNMYLEVAAELGLPGFALFAALLVLTAATSERVRRATDDPLPVVAVQAALIAVVVASTFLSEQYYLPLWSLVAVVAAADLRLRRTSDLACAPRDQ